MAAGLWQAIRHDQGIPVYESPSEVLWELRQDVVGTVLPSPPKSVITEFDTATIPPAPLLLKAQLELKCHGGADPIVVGWKITEDDGEAWTRYGWARCLPNGLASASLTAMIPHAIKNFTVSASTGPSIDMGLELSSARASFRHDLMADRDLSSRMVRGLRLDIAAWIRPGAPSMSPVVRGRKESAQGGAVIVKFSPAVSPASAMRVHAELALDCRPQQNAPIVMAWKLSETGGDDVTKYNWAICKPDGHALALLDVVSPHNVTYLTATAVSSNGADMQLVLTSASARFQPDLPAPQLSWFAQWRTAIADWLTPYSLVEVTPP